MNRISLRFPYDSELIEVVSGFPDARWSRHIEDRNDLIPLLSKAFHRKVYPDYSGLKSNHVEKTGLKKRGRKKTENDLKSKVSNMSGLPSLSDKGKADIERFKR